MNHLQIFARIKPGLQENQSSCVNCVENEIMIQKKKKAYHNNYLVNHKYKFDKVFDDLTINAELYNYVSIQILRSMMKHQKNVTFYVYGQTGSGKTHTLLGKEGSEAGFLDMILSDMIEIDGKVKVSALEIYNNKCYDILNNRNQITQQENYSKQFVFPYLENNLTSIQEIKSLKSIISKNRKTGVSGQNDTSSRSHLLLNIQFFGKTLRLLDLAGCEKAKASICKNKKEFKENGEINQSLFALKECIRALVQKKTHIPFRRSELTKILKQSFESSCMTYVMGTISQNPVHVHTTLDVMNYIVDMKKIKRSVPNGNNMILPVIGSPRFSNFLMKKDFISQIQDEETKLFDKMISKQTTKNMYEKYMDLVDKKKELLTNVQVPYNPLPPKYPRKITDPSPRKKHIKKQ